MALLATAASANFIVNGDFETSVPSNGTGGGWTSSHIDSAGGWRSSGGNLGGKFILNDAGSSVSDPTIMQTVTGLTAGNRYLLSGDYASSMINNSPSGATNSFEVLVNGVVVFQGAPTNLHSWTHFEVEFFASDEALDIALRAEANGSDNDFEIDNIVLDVPAAGTLTLIGLGGLTTLRRRR
ncbi:MAG: hypothetical protein DYG94_13040 [Leptolyngbya sp. PLA3]|nr:MAG: hypothetical protein EDM82_03215 [Cyanobacteria bacterium CYA]MCE7969651.1 hypothetical protein [Leptolyngbya sp. PL-A3]